MNEIKDGGPAFPVTIPCHKPGISIRDYFAAKAMQGLVSHVGSNSWSNSDVAIDAYKLADEMLKARGA